MPVSLGSMASYMATVKKDKGFYFVSAVIKCIVGNHVNIYFIVLAAIQAGVLIYVYRKYSSRYLVSFFLFIASTDYISWLFNGIRQFLAVTITFIGIKFILDKKYAKAIILILIASLMHQSALLVIPFIFIAQGKAWNKKTLLFMVAVIVIVAGIGQFTNVLDSMLAETQYKNVVSDWQSWNDDGTNALRVLVYAVPSVLSLIGLRFIRNEDDKVINLCTNMSIVSVGFYIVSMFTSGIFIGRLPMIAPLSELDEEALIQILTQPKNALTKQYQALFGLEDVELEFTPEALKAMAKKALERKTGARGLRSIVEAVLLDTMYDLPSIENLQKVIVDEETIVDNKPPKLEYKN